MEVISLTTRSDRFGIVALTYRRLGRTLTDSRYRFGFSKALCWADGLRLQAGPTGGRGDGHPLIVGITISTRERSRRKGCWLRLGRRQRDFRTPTYSVRLGALLSLLNSVTAEARRNPSPRAIELWTLLGTTMLTGSFKISSRFAPMECLRSMQRSQILESLGQRC